MEDKIFQPATEQNFNQQTQPVVDYIDFNKFFPDDVRSDPDFAKYSQNFPKDINSLAKDYYHKNKQFGKAKELAKAELQAELSKEKNYNLEDYNYELPKDYELEDNTLNVAKNKAKELGIDPKIAKQFIEEIIKADHQEELKLKQQFKEDDQRKAEEIYNQNKKIRDEFKAEWGLEYEAKVKSANDTLQKFTTAEEFNILTENLDMKSQVILSKIFNKIHERISESNIGIIQKIVPTAPIDITKELNNIDNLYQQGKLSWNEHVGKKAELKQKQQNSLMF